MQNSTGGNHEPRRSDSTQGISPGAQWCLGGVHARYAHNGRPGRTAAGGAETGEYEPAGRVRRQGTSFLWHAQHTHPGPCKVV